MKLAAKVEPSPAKIEILAELGWQHVEIYTSQAFLAASGSAGLLRAYIGQMDYVVHAPTDYFDESVIGFAKEIQASLINTHKIVTNSRLQELVDLASSSGITVTVENEAFPESHHLDKHGNPLFVSCSYDPIRSCGDFRRLVEEIPQVRLCVDVEHAMIRKEYPDIISGCCEYLGHIHMCGFTGGRHHMPVYNNMALMKEVAAMLRDCDYEGFVVCEHDVEFHTREVWKRTLEECAPLFEE